MPKIKISDILKHFKISEIIIYSLHFRRVENLISTAQKYCDEIFACKNPPSFCILHSAFCILHFALKKLPPKRQLFIIKFTLLRRSQKLLPSACRDIREAAFLPYRKAR